MRASLESEENEEGSTMSNIGIAMDFERGMLIVKKKISNQ